MMTQENKQVIYKGSHIALYMSKVSESKVVYSFTGHEGHPGTVLYGDGFIQNQGYTGIFFVSLKNHWWQTEELDEAIDIANRHTVGYTDRIAYGQSMGGYGALLSAARLNSRAVVTAPQTTINPKYAFISDVWMKDIQQYKVHRDNVLEELDGVRSVRIIYDNKGAGDESHIRHIGKRDNIFLYPLPYATHNVPRALLEMGVLSNVMGRILSDSEFCVYEFRKIIRESRARSASYLNRLRGLTLRSRNPWLPRYYKSVMSSVAVTQFDNNTNNAPILKLPCEQAPKIGSIRLGPDVELMDKQRHLYFSKGKDPQIIIEAERLPAELEISFYSSARSTGNIFFKRVGSTSGFSAKDSIGFDVRPGVNVVVTSSGSGLGGEITAIRLDPISHVGFFSMPFIRVGSC